MSTFEEQPIIGFAKVCKDISESNRVCERRPWSIFCYLYRIQMFIDWLLY